MPQERRRMVMTLLPTDWAAEWVRPTTPDFKMVGPVLTGPGKPLPADLEAFITDAKAGKQGVLLASLGTIAELDKEELASMAAAFATLPCKVLWRLTPKEVPDEAAVAALNLGPNTQAGRLPCQCLCLRSNATGTVILAPDRLATCCTIFLRIKLAQSCSERALGVQVVTWVPQNDILAHPNLRAFLSHVGINSMYEAIYHGKPIVGMPFFGDQPSNADRVVAKGLGLQLRPAQAGKPAFREALVEVLSNQKYAKAAKAMSVKIRARKNTPVQEAADWIEHVIATGGEPYLRTPENEMSLIVVEVKPAG
ncbi:hypothetical protein CVIRNUC_009806 [Coccomyxa viridis]|uniref:Uncharacterized protein n=1 Tax=Coccomyxa viridis TaxID=1274662 RepID=A0AAV1IIT7_9CHLO|nr:hypothetical protein CVIRNUC_009806 [Coccomyxa viridis]